MHRIRGWVGIRVEDSAGRPSRTERILILQLECRSQDLTLDLASLP
jgi:hypothetical protein